MALYWRIRWTFNSALMALGLRVNGSVVPRFPQVKKRSVAFKEANPNYRKKANHERFERSSKSCVECGKTFKSITTKKYCSPECRKKGLYAKGKYKL